MKVLGAIIAGGKSIRMGQEKALIMWRGKTLIEHVAERLAPQVDELVINATGDPTRFILPVIPDLVETGTPLAGLHAALTFAAKQKFDAVLSVPSDTPLLPHNLRAKLEQAAFTLPPSGEGGRAAIAVSGNQAHFLTGLWSVDCLAPLKNLRRVMDFAEATKARRVSWPIEGFDPFFNINTPQDLSDLP